MSLHISIIGRERVEAKLRDPELVRKPAARMIDAAARFTEVEARSGLGNGAIARGFAVETHGLSARVHNTAPGAMAAEFGRYPGTPPPPWRTLREWARAHGLSGLEVPIARAISRRGIRGRFFMRRAVEKLRHIELPRLAERMKADVQAEWMR